VNETTRPDERDAQPAAPMTAAEGRFDVRAFVRTAHGSLREGFDPAAFAASPLPERVLAALRFLRDSERGTMSQLRNMLVTPTHKDARVTSFLNAWAYEKFWIADALDAVIAAHGDVVAASQRRASGLVRGWRMFRERIRPIVGSVRGNRAGDDIVAVHVTLGAVDEWVSGLWYDQIDARAAHPELTAVLDRIRRVKERHVAFFEVEARARLDASVRARRMVAAELRNARFPIPGPFSSPGEAADLAREVLTGAASRLQEIAGRIAALPGQARSAARVALS
jgi:hypothetical protein